MKLHQVSADHYAFHCPGCRCGHHVKVNGAKFENGAGWQWNGSMDAPTFSPSIKCDASEFTELGQQQYKDWSEKGVEIPGGKIDSRATVCHSFVRDGKIQFLGDCTHELTGQTVEIPDWDE